MKLFVAQGFEHTPTSQISKDAGVATGTLFHHFSSKEILINEIYRYVKRSMGAFVFVGLDKENDVRSQIKLVWTNLLKWGFKYKLENQFLTRFYGSTYISGLTVQEMQSLFKPAVELFYLADKQKLVKKLSFALRENLTMAMAQSFLTEFYRLNRLDKKLLNMSFTTYWDAIKK